LELELLELELLELELLLLQDDLPPDDDLEDDFVYVFFRDIASSREIQSSVTEQWSRARRFSGAMTA